jgi:REP element-mobilizing transposase RayT
MAEHRRRSIRLKGYDYSSPGLYFITICVQDRSCVFGEIEDAVCRLSPAGDVIERKWRSIGERFAMVEIGPYVVMPNHLHGLLHINAPHPDDSSTTTPSSTIGSMIQWFKTGTTYDYISGVKQQGWPPFNKRLWQRNYWEHIVRNEREHERIANYILANPSSWPEDSLHPDAAG